MLFPTIRFAIFFALVLPTSWLLMPRPTRWKAFAVAASLVFYGSWDARYVLLLVASILANQLVALRIAGSDDGAKRDRWTALGVAVNLGVLGWYKYVDFLAGSSADLAGWLGYDWHPTAPRILLPIGISFFTFQALSYVIDVRRRLITPVPTLDFAVYLSFFPHLVAGPIVRAREFLPQLRSRRDPRHIDGSLALWLIASGLIKKVVVSTYLAGAADALFAVPERHGGFEALLGVYAYALQIYADFSGYTDIAIGIALLLGFRFPANFDAPYSATSLRDFWRRWHMTLSRWLRDYLYVPLGGSRGGRLATYRNLMLTMLLGGLWHGAGWTFVAWGALHGLGLAWERWRDDRRAVRTGPGDPPAAEAEVVVEGAVGPVDAAPGRSAGPAGFWMAPPPLVVASLAAVGAAGSGAGAGALEEAAEPAGAAAVEAVAEAATVEEPEPVDPRLGAEPHYAIRGAEPATARVWLRRLATFHLVCLGWVFFRATSFGNAFTVLGRLVRSGSTPVDWWVAVVVVGMLALHHVPAGAVGRLQVAWSRMRLRWQVAALVGALLVLDVLGPTGVPPFIYFQF